MTAFSAPAAITLWAALRLTHGQRYAGSWADFLASFVTPRTYPTKDAAPGWSPATFRGDVRGLANVESVSALVLDDDSGATSLDAACALWGAYAGAVHTSWSSTPETPRHRTVLLLSRPVSVAEHARLWTWAASRAPIDANAADASRFWYAPASRPGYEARLLEGAPLNVDATLPQSCGNPPVPDGRGGTIATPSISAGGRNATLTSLAGSMRARGMGEDAIVAALLAHNATACDPPLAAAEVERIARSIATYPAGPGFRLSETGNAARLADQVRGRARFDVSRARWFAWDGKRWAEQGAELALEREAKNMVAALYSEAAACPESTRRKSLGAWAKASDNRSKIVNAIWLARSEDGIAIDARELDADPWVLCVTNGVIDLRTGLLRPHDPADLITKLAPIEYDPAAKCPRFDRFLSEAIPDPTVRAYLARLFGYGATGVIREHVLPIFYGSGRNGKGVLDRITRHVLGEYAAAVPVELLMQSRGDRHPTERASLFGVRLASASETEECRALNVSMVKALTGNDAIKARRMREDFWEFNPTHKLVLATNHKPVVRETKDAIWSRVQLVPWTVSFLGREDLELDERLRAEGPGVLAWLVRGCLEWQRIGLAPPQSVLLASATYRQEQDTFGDFLSECCVLEPGARVSRTALRWSYETWCNDIGERYPLQPKAFAERLREHGVSDAFVGDARGWAGIRVRGGVPTRPTRPTPDPGFPP